MNDNSTKQEMAMQRAARLALARAELARREREQPGSVPRYDARVARLARAGKRNQERVDHLVHGYERPVEKVIMGKRHGRRRPRDGPDLRRRRSQPVDEDVRRRHRFPRHRGTGAHA